eukprot:TRINITY_DN9633_c0_g1_i4.p1 TRINITY_DN9633_c0_g1~~TRINITY_DN9633_c0_g1_i4.p1  ORF type:complete len:497 (+),score=117.54 TRINITY_DN9633_c0_g1_i4:260-1750(+)
MEEGGGFEICGVQSGLGQAPREVKVRVKNLVMALGACQNLDGVETGLRRKTITGLHALTDTGISDMRTQLANLKSRRVLIIGGSHTAFSTAWALLNKVTTDLSKPEDKGQLWNWKKGEIMLVHRSKIRLYYNSAAEARKDGYADIDDDSTSRSGKINLFSGLRGDAKQLYKDIASGKEKRVQLCKLSPDAVNVSVGKGAVWKSVLAGVELIVLATGLRTSMVPVIRPDGTVADFMVDGQGQLRSDEQGRLLQADGKPMLNVFGIGAGHGHPADSGLIQGETHSSLRRADGVRMYVQLYGHILLSNLINLPETHFPESPAPKKLVGSPESSTSPLIHGPAAKRAAFDSPAAPEARTDRAALCSIAHKERTPTSPGRESLPTTRSSSCTATSQLSPTKPVSSTVLSPGTKRASTSGPQATTKSRSNPVRTTAWKGPEDNEAVRPSPIHTRSAKSTPRLTLSLIHISEPTRLLSISYAVFCLKKKKKKTNNDDKYAMVR